MGVVISHGVLEKFSICTDFVATPGSPRSHSRSKNSPSHVHECLSTAGADLSRGRPTFVSLGKTGHPGLSRGRR